MKKPRLLALAVVAVLALTFTLSCGKGQKAQGGQVAATDSINWEDSIDKLCEQAWYYKNFQPDSLEMFVPGALKTCLEHNMMGQYYFIWGKLVSKYIWEKDFDKGVAEAQRMHDDATSRHNDYGIFQSYKLLGISYGISGDYPESRKYLQKSIDCFPDDSPVADLNDAYSYLYLTLECDKQYAALDTVMAAWKTLIDEYPVIVGEPGFESVASWHSSYQADLARFLVIKEDYKGAALALDSSEYYENVTGEEVPAVNQLENLILRTDLAKHEGNYRKMLEYCNTRLKMAEECGEITHTTMAMLDLTNAYVKLGDYENAYKVQDKYTALKDSLAVVDNHEQLNELNKRFEVSELKMKAERQQMEAERQQIKAERHQLYLVIAIILVVLLAVVAFAYYRRRADKRMAAITAEKERIEGELQIARDIQMSMVPSQFPDYQGLDMFALMSPAKEVGGDLYGYVLQGDKLYFALGDVSGKGVPASLFMAQATRLFRMLATQGLMPAEICTNMNDALSGEDNENGMFVTFFLGLIDLKEGHLYFCNAGHNPPVIGGGENNGDFLNMEPNAPIGLWPGLEFEGEEIENILGRPLFIYTDGLNEAENQQQEQFGDDRLLDILRTTHFDSAKQVVETLKERVEEHRNGANPNDDLTMMCIRFSK